MIKVDAVAVLIESVGQHTATFTKAVVFSSSDVPRL